MCKIATAGSQEAKKLEEVKRAFEKAYRETKKNSELTVDKEADIRYNKNSLYEQIVRKKRKTNQNEFWVNDFDNCYKVRIDEDLSYVITDTIPINGNEDYIKEIMRSIKDVNASRKNTSNSNEHAKSYGGINSGDYAESQGEQSWSEFIDELLEKFESEGIVRKYNSSQGRSDSEGRKYSVNNETSSNDDVFFDSKTKYSFSGEKALSPDNNLLHSNKDIYGKDIELITPEQIAPVQEKVEEVNTPLPENTTPDLNLPLPDGYPTKPVETVKERNTTKLRELNHKVETDRQLQKETHNNFNKQIAEIQSSMDKVEELRKDAVADFKKKTYALQTEYDAKENKTTKAANELLQKIERLNAKQKEVDISYENQLLDMKHKIEDIIGKLNDTLFLVGHSTTTFCRYLKSHHIISLLQENNLTYAFIIT